MIRLPVVLLLLSCALAASAQTDFQVRPATDITGEADQPHLAVSTSGWAALAYVAETFPIPEELVRVQHFWATEEPWPTVWEDPTGFGPGSGPRVCWSRDGWVLAYVSADAVLVHERAVPGDWSASPQILFPGHPVLGIDLQGDAAPGPGARAALVATVDTDPPYGPFRILYAELGDGGWSAFETVAETGFDRPWPRLALARDGDELRPTVWYLGDDGLMGLRLHRRVRDGGVWQPAESLPDEALAVQGEFAVGVFDDGAADVLGLGMQPTCPCGSIHHLRVDGAGVWSPSQTMTQHYDFYDWPMFPCLVAGADGRAHAFWSQLGSDPTMHPHRRTLEYHVREGGVWSDQGDVLDEQPRLRLGARVALAVTDRNEPLLAWTRTDTIGDQIEPQRIWIARVDPAMSAPPAAAGLALDVHPSPFNPRTTLTVTAPRGGPVTVLVCDPRGRVVRRLVGVADASEPLTLSWNGRDDAGRPVPAGVYAAQARVGDRRTTRKLTLIR